MAFAEGLRSDVICDAKTRVLPLYQSLSSMSTGLPQGSRSEAPRACAVSANHCARRQI